MRLTAAGGTDGATMVLFWPANLPDDADRLLRDDPIALFEKLDGEGKLIYFPCEGDGGYTLGVYLHEDVPAELAAFCREHRKYPHLLVSGEGYFGGGECVFKRDAGFIEKYRHMAGKVTVPDGTYDAAVYATDVPRSFYGKWLREHAGPSAKRAGDAYGVMWGFIIGGVLATLFGLFLMPWKFWFLFAGGTAALIAATFALSRSAAYKKVVAARAEFARAFPAYVVRLK
jgi:hypothetical protein